MNTKTSKILKYLLSASLAAVLLYFSFRGVDWREFRAMLTRCSWMYVGLSMLAGLAGFIIRALRWRLLLLPVDSSTRVVSCYDGFTIGRLADFVIPHVGEFVRCGYVSRGRVSYDKALGTVVLERTWDIFTLMLLLVLVLFFKWSDFGAFFMDRILTPATGALNISLWWLLSALLLAVTAAVSAVVLCRRRFRIAGRVYDFFRGILQGAASCLKMRHKGMFLLYTVLLWISFILTCWFMMEALPSDYGFTPVDALFLTLVGSIAGIVPVPGGFGAFHYMVALAVQTLYDLPFDTGIILATLCHEAQAVTMLAAGLLSYAHQAVSPRNTYIDSNN